MDSITQIFMDQGFSFIVLTLLMWLGYRFINIRLEIMKKQLEADLKQHKYTITGNIKISDDKKEIDLTGDLAKVEVQ